MFLKATLALLKFHARNMTHRVSGEQKTLKIQNIYKEYIHSLSYDIGMSPVDMASMIIQDEVFPANFLHVKKLMIFVVPCLNDINGGILSIFSIASHVRNVKSIHGYDVLIATHLDSSHRTYFRNTNFRNSENIFRLGQISHLSALRDIYIHIPECFIQEYTTGDNLDILIALSKKGDLNINILNQNIDQMPPPSIIQSLLDKGFKVTQSVAHHRYSNQNIANCYNIPTLLLPAYIDMQSYPASKFMDKQNLIIYSNDVAPYKNSVIEKLQKELPEFRLVEINNIPFEGYMELATNCMFSISFGEGFDGYLNQPINQGSIGFAIYNDRFFPSESFKRFENIFTNSDNMLDNICHVINRLRSNPSIYMKLNEEFKSELDLLYNYEDYKKRIKMLSLQNYDYFPNNFI